MLFSITDFFFIYFYIPGVDCILFLNHSCLHLSSHLGAYNLQHDQLAGTKFVSKSNNSSLISAHCHKEYIHIGVERTKLGSCLSTPEPNTAILGTRCNNLIVWRNGNTRNLQKKKKKKCIYFYLYQETIISSGFRWDDF